MKYSVGVVIGGMSRDCTCGRFWALDLPETVKESLQRVLGQHIRRPRRHCHPTFKHFKDTLAAHCIWYTICEWAIRLAFMYFDKKENQHFFKSAMFLGQCLLYICTIPAWPSWPALYYDSLKVLLASVIIWKWNKI